MSAAKAVVVGHLMVTAPVVLTVLFIGLGGYLWYGTPGLLIGFLVGSGAAWLWWSWTVPKWRRWALDRGAPPDQLQHLAEVTGLVWPKGWIFERTEFRSKDGE